MNTPVTIVLPKRKLDHQALIANALPGWIAKRPLKQLEQLKTVRPVLPDWFKKATAAQHKELRNTATDLRDAGERQRIPGRQPQASALG
jgi:hypothetical protein